jgi:hypothetical protein
LLQPVHHRESWEIGRYLVTFISNHDSFWQPSGRFPAQADDDQVIAAIGFLLCLLETPCIYYGDEQGLAGTRGDNQVHQALFDTTGNRSLLNTQCRIYQEIAKIAAVMRVQEPLRFGRMYYREISGDGQHFGLPGILEKASVYLSDADLDAGWVDDHADKSISQPFTAQTSVTVTHNLGRHAARLLKPSSAAIRQFATPL